ncbi:MAG: DNA-deoxyinosine glycosylase [Deltaproteobacteria bacterium]|nr:DNA-deoxyinosine glycosylase [Deltaproteobacteria bacterium]
MSFVLSQGFPPVAALDAEILILGSMPGKKSLQAEEYYAHPQNVFWDIMNELIQAGRHLTYLQRLQILQKNHIALWDVAFQCEREGSLDAKIRMQSVRVNDFKTFFLHHSKIRHIFFNGQKAEQLFHQRVRSEIENFSISMKRLPSTSPAHAHLSRAEKIKEWRSILRK